MKVNLTPLFSFKAAMSIMLPNHWHLLLWPRRDGKLSDFGHWLTLTHTQRWHAHYHHVGIGHVYQGRFKSFVVDWVKQVNQPPSEAELKALRQRVQRSRPYGDAT